ncbi:hypothetical protein [Nonomuraea sp. B19D2]|uniref:hypothetical protein n=1 Tax=Nonomuraea sp. B19D2 TaxID=3159561 RepID=UPI0032DB851C
MATQAMLAVLCVVPPLYGLLGHVHVRGADRPAAALQAGSWASGGALTGVLAAGAFAAFLATMGGVLVTVGCSCSCPGRRRA